MEAILGLPSQGGRILSSTLDKDFGELAIVRGASHAGIVRIVLVFAAAVSGVLLARSRSGFIARRLQPARS